MSDFITEYDGQDCFDLTLWVEHCQNLFDSVEGGYIVAFTLMQINGWKEEHTKFKDIPILD